MDKSIECYCLLFDGPPIDPKTGHRPPCRFQPPVEPPGRARECYVKFIDFHDTGVQDWPSDVGAAPSDGYKLCREVVGNPTEGELSATKRRMWEAGKSADAAEARVEALEAEVTRLRDAIADAIKWGEHDYLCRRGGVMLKAESCFCWKSRLGVALGRGGEPKEQEE